VSFRTNDDPGINTARLTQQTVSTQYKLAAGDTAQVIVVQNSGADLSVDQYAATSLNLAWIGSVN
jgi:protein involved in polysaccharide export with SLBB domain